MGYTRLVTYIYFLNARFPPPHTKHIELQRVVGLKHLRNKKVGSPCLPGCSTSSVRIDGRATVIQEHAASAQIACEVAGAIKTVASLTREQAFYKEYSDSLELPLQRSNRLSLWTSALFGLVQSFLYLTAALVSNGLIQLCDNV